MLGSSALIGSKKAHHDSLDMCNINSPSAFGKVDSVTGWHKMYEKLHLKIHRPHYLDFGITTTLLHPAFGKFVDIFTGQNVEDIRSDNEFAIRFSSTMCQVFSDESKRNTEVNCMLSEYLNSDIQPAHLVPGKKSETDGTLFTMVNGARVPLCIFEVKNELGSGSSDPTIQGLGYYMQILQSKSHFRECTSMPVLLLSISGPFLLFFFLANTDAVVMDPAAFLCCFFLPQDVPQMTQLARALRAMKECIKELERSYQNTAGMVAQDVLLEQLQFPYFKSFPLPDGKKVELVYIKQVERRLVFLAQTQMNGQDTTVIVKFARSYNVEAHKICYSFAEGAPKLFYHGQLNGSWTVMVMEYLTAMSVVGKKCLTLLQYQSLSNLITELHSEGYVHGDLREYNIMVGDETDRVCLIDFDWAGKEGEAIYPNFMNHIDVQWPAGASDGKKILKEHDLYFLSNHRSYIVT